MSVFIFNRYGMVRVDVPDEPQESLTYEACLLRVWGESRKENMTPEPTGKTAENFRRV